MKLHEINRCDFFILLWTLYQLQEVLYSPGMISTLTGVLLIMICSVDTFKYFKNKSGHNRFLNSTLGLLVVFIIYGILRIITGNEGNLSTPTYYYLQYSLLSLTPIFLFCNYSRAGLISEKRLRIYFVIFFIVAISGYYKYFNQQLLLNDAIEQDATTNNSGYLFLNLLPFLFLFKKPIARYTLLAVVLIFVIICMKRGAILIAAICAIFLVWRSYKETPNRVHKFIIVISVILCVCVLSHFISSLIEGNDYFAFRLEQTKEGKASDRNSIYSSIWRIIIQSDPFHFLFGHGAYSTVAIDGRMAHQDWLEVMCNNGLVGVFAMISFFKSFWRKTQSLKFHRLQHNPCYDMLFMVFVIIFLKTMFSMSIMDIPVSLSILIGYCMQNSNNRVQNKQELMQ